MLGRTSSANNSRKWSAKKTTSLRTVCSKHCPFCRLLPSSNNKQQRKKREIIFRSIIHFGRGTKKKQDLSSQKKVSMSSIRTHSNLFDNYHIVRCSQRNLQRVQNYYSSNFHVKLYCVSKIIRFSFRQKIKSGRFCKAIQGNYVISLFIPKVVHGKRLSYISFANHSNSVKYQAAAMSYAWNIEKNIQWYTIIQYRTVQITAFLNTSNQTEHSFQISYMQ